MELLAVKIDVFYDEWRAAQSKRLEIERQYPQRPVANTTHLSKASPQDLRSYLGLLAAEAEATRVFEEWGRNIQGTEQTILNKDLRIEAILAAEKNQPRLARTATTQ